MCIVRSRFKVKFSKILLFAALAVPLVFCNQLQAANKPNNEPWVNVLTWWGYLDDPRIKQEVQDQCHVNLSYDEYYTNEQFLSMFNKYKQNYDILIFSNLLYNGMQSKIADNNSDLWQVSNDYYPYFKQYYQSHDYDHNVVFFTHSMMGFLYNPDLIHIDPSQNIFEIFKDAGSNYVILVDDPAEVHNLLNLGYQTSGQNWPSSIYGSDGMLKLNYDNLKRVTQNSNVYITNDFNKIYTLNNFAFSFMWSGDALLSVDQSNKPYKFSLHPDLSYVCTDLLAQIKETPAASCVAHVLAGQKVMGIVENSSYYFSPYFQNNVNTPDFNALYAETKAILPKLSWIQPMTIEQFNDYDKEWEQVKLDLDNAKPAH